MQRFLGIRSSFNGIFLPIQFPYILVWLSNPSNRGLHAILLEFEIFFINDWCIFYALECKRWILYIFGGGDFWSSAIVRCQWICGKYLW